MLAYRAVCEWHGQSLSIRKTSASIRGTITTKKGQPVAHEEVDLKAGQTTLRTFTDSRGNYYFYNSPQGSADLLVRGSQHAVKIEKTTSSKNIHL
jgi:hypothetical protein